MILSSHTYSELRLSLLSILVVLLLNYIQTALGDMEGIIVGLQERAVELKLYVLIRS